MAGFLAARAQQRFRIGRNVSYTHTQCVEPIAKAAANDFCNLRPIFTVSPRAAHRHIYKYRLMDSNYRCGVISVAITTSIVFVHGCPLLHLHSTYTHVCVCVCVRPDARAVHPIYGAMSKNTIIPVNNRSASVACLMAHACMHTRFI